MIATLSSILIFTSQGHSLTNSEPALDAQWAPVVWIEIDGKEQDGSVGPGYCVATLLSAEILVTAAHCVNDAIELNLHTLKTQTGRYLLTHRPDGRVVRVGYKRDPAVVSQAQFFSANLDPGSGDDVALIVLEVPLVLPVNFPFAQVVSADEWRGMQNQLQDYSPTLVTVNPIAEITTTDTRRMARLTDVAPSWRGGLSGASRARVEEGDSGSPLFVKVGATWKILAVTKGRGQNLFSNWDVFGTLPDNLCALAQGRLLGPNLVRLCH